MIAAVAGVIAIWSRFGLHIASDLMLLGHVEARTAGVLACRTRLVEFGIVAIALAIDGQINASLVLIVAAVIVSRTPGLWLDAGCLACPGILGTILLLRASRPTPPSPSCKIHVSCMDGPLGPPGPLGPLPF